MIEYICPHCESYAITDYTWKNIIMGTCNCCKFSGKIEKFKRSVHHLSGGHY